MVRYRNGRPKPDNQLGTVEAALIAKKHPRTIVAWIHAGKLPAWKMPGERGPYVIDRGDLEELVATLSTPKPYIPKGDR